MISVIPASEDHPWQHVGRQFWTCDACHKIRHSESWRQLPDRWRFLWKESAGGFEKCYLCDEHLLDVRLNGARLFAQSESGVLYPIEEFQ